MLPSFVRFPFFFGFFLSKQDGCRVKAAFFSSRFKNAPLRTSYFSTIFNSRHKISCLNLSWMTKPCKQVFNISVQIFICLTRSTDKNFAHKYRLWELYRRIRNQIAVPYADPENSERVGRRSGKERVTSKCLRDSGCVRGPVRRKRPLTHFNFLSSTHFSFLGMAKAASILTRSLFSMKRARGTNIICDKIQLKFRCAVAKGKNSLWSKRIW